MKNIVRTSSCKCGQVKFEAIADPILCAVCYCDDCQAGGHMLEDLPNTGTVLDEDGGTQYLTFRDDCFTCIKGSENLKAYKLKETAPTKRYVATCCGTPMYLKFGPGHWVSAYRRQFSGELPPIEMRTQTRFRTSNLPMPDDAKTYRRFPLKLFSKLIKARISMFLGN